MSNVCLIIAVAALFYSVNKERNLFYPGIYMYGIWSVILSLNKLQLFGIFQASNQAYGIALTGLLSYIVGAVLAKTIEKKYKTISILARYQKVSQINYRIVYALTGLTIMFIVIDAMLAGKYLLSGYSLWQVRAWMTETFENATNPMLTRRSFLEQVIRVLVISPFQMALYPLCAIDFFFGFRKKRLLLFALFILAMGIVSGGGARLGVIIFALSFLITFSIYQSRYRLNVFNSREQKTMHRKMRLIIVIGFLVVAFLTTRRTSKSIFVEAYYYFALCMPLLSFWLPTISTYPRTYGMMSFFGIMRIPFLILEKIGLFSSALYERCYQYMTQANTFQKVGTISANSFVTPYYYMFIDGGYVGIVVGYLIIGFVATRFYQKISKFYNLRDIYFLVMFNIGLFYSFIRLEFAATNYAIAVLCAAVLIRKYAVEKKPAF